MTDDTGGDVDWLANWARCHVCDYLIAVPSEDSLQEQSSGDPVDRVRSIRTNANYRCIQCPKCLAWVGVYDSVPFTENVENE